MRATFYLKVSSFTSPFSVERVETWRLSESRRSFYTRLFMVGEQFVNLDFTPDPIIGINKVDPTINSTTVLHNTNNNMPKTLSPR
jgi:hypothetical protein